MSSRKFTTIATLFISSAGVRAFGQCLDAWYPGPHFAGVAGYPHAMTVWDRDGSDPTPPWLIVAGQFAVARNISALNIAAWDGARWHSFGEGLFVDDNNPWVGIQALHVHRGELYAGGDFTASGERSVPHVARWDGRDWQPLGAGVNARVQALASFRGDLIAAGEFSQAGSATTNRIARWDGQQWAPLAGGIDGWSVYALAEFAGDLIAAGSFHAAGGMPASAIAAWDGSEWRPLGSGIGDRDGFPWVKTLVEFEGALLAGGEFETAGGVPARNFAEWDGQTWRPVYSSFDWSVETLRVIAGQLVVAGYTTEYQSALQGSVMRLEGGAWNRLGPTSGAYATDLAEFGGRIVACGMGENTPANVCQWVDPFWRTLGSPPDVESELSSFAEYNGDLVAGVSFMRSDASRGPFVRWTGQHWSQLGFAPRADPVTAMTVFRGDLFASGVFTDGDYPSAGLLRFNGSQWLPQFGAPFAWSLCVYHDELIAGSIFVFAWNGERWRQIDPGFDGRVRTLGVFRDELIAAGGFEHVTPDGTVLNHIAAWNGASWRAIGAIDYDVWDVAVHRDRLVAAGDFPRVDDLEVNGIAQWDGATWSRLGADLGGEGPVYDLTLFRDDLIASGAFAHAGGIEVNGIARWDGAAWHPLGEGVTAPRPYYGVAAMIEHDNTLFVSGSFYQLGDEVSAFWGRWGPRMDGDVNLDADVDIADLYWLLARFGTSSDATPQDGDTDADGDIDVQDLASLLANFGTTCDE